jgi:hypothetical protein
VSASRDRDEEPAMKLAKRTALLYALWLLVFAVLLLTISAFFGVRLMPWLLRDDSD